MKETDILGHVPCSTLPQKDYNIDLRDTNPRTCGRHHSPHGNGTGLV